MEERRKRRGLFLTRINRVSFNPGYKVLVTLIYKYSLQLQVVWIAGLVRTAEPRLPPLVLIEFLLRSARDLS